MGVRLHLGVRSTSNVPGVSPSHLCPSLMPGCLACPLGLPSGAGHGASAPRRQSSSRTTPSSARPPTALASRSTLRHAMAKGSRSSIISGTGRLRSARVSSGGRLSKEKLKVSSNWETRDLGASGRQTALSYRKPIPFSIELAPLVARPSLTPDPSLCLDAGNGIISEVITLQPCTSWKPGQRFNVGWAARKRGIEERAATIAARDDEVSAARGRRRCDSR